MKVLIAAAECTPLARTGGLGEAVAGLAHALTDEDIDVTVAIPRYRHLASLGRPASGAAPVYRTDLEGVPLLLVDDPEAFDREGIYGPHPGAVYDDEWWRWSRFSRHVAQLAADFDVLHVHDAHPAAAALITQTPTVLTIHNASYPIIGPLRDVSEILEVDPEYRRLGGALEWYGQANLLKAGLIGAARVTTVSPSFAKQLSVDTAVTAGLNEVIRWLPKPVIGILNGIDSERWDPRHDPALPEPFRWGRFHGRRKAKEVLLDHFGLEDGFLLGNVGRMTEQKGLHLFDDIIGVLVDEGFRLLLVGNGDLDDLVNGWAESHPRAISHQPYDEKLARLTFAGADSYVMPSRFEPCGLGQMYAMRYGAPPVAHLTGGLADTVVDLDEVPDRATGFAFRLLEPIEILKTLRRARRIRERHKGLWRHMQYNGMTQDWSWHRAAGEYAAVYAAVSHE